jgi:hypothetical protein
MNYEEELQKRVEGDTGNPEGDLDVKVYQKIFVTLSKTSEINISPSFADRIVQITSSKLIRESRRDLWWLGCGIAMLLIAFVVAIIYTGFKIDMGFLSAMADYKGLFIFGIVFVIALNWIDKRIVKKAHGSGQ